MIVHTAKTESEDRRPEGMDGTFRICEEAAWPAEHGALLDGEAANSAGDSKRKCQRTRRTTCLSNVNLDKESSRTVIMSANKRWDGLVSRPARSQSGVEMKNSLRDGSSSVGELRTTPSGIKKRCCVCDF